MATSTPTEQHAVREFRLEEAALRRRTVISAIWCLAAFSPISLTGLPIVLQSLGFLTGLDIGPFIVAGLMGTVIGVCTLAFHETASFVERQMVFVLDDQKITQKRPRFPDVAIPFSEIRFLREELRWLIVKSDFPQRKIGIPKDVDGYDLIRAELAKHHPLSPSAKLPPAGALLQAGVPLLASVAAWAGILWSRDLRTLILGGAVAIMALGFASYRLLLHRGRNRWPTVICLLSPWLIAAILIYRAFHRFA